MQLKFEIEDEDTVFGFAGNGADLAAFLSFAAMSGFGANHPLIALADRMHSTHGVRLGPLTTFYEAEAEDSEDVERLDLAWQTAGDLLDSVSSACSAIERDPMCLTLIRRAGTELLVQNLSELRMHLDALDPASRVRLTYIL